MKITAGGIRTIIETYVREYPKTLGITNIWRKPLAAFASVDDRFSILPTIAAPDHALPKDLLPEGRTVIVFFIPFTRALAKENHPGETPCLNWGVAYQQTNVLINLLCRHIQQMLEKAGYASALVPATHNFDHETLMARWSHKHLGYISGLGRFGVNAQFITPSGCAGRLGSLVTAADLGNHPLVKEKELCLHKNGHECLVCVSRCPVGAVSEKTGIARQKCWVRLKENLKILGALQVMDPSTHVCGKCQVLLPCSLNAPGRDVQASMEGCQPGFRLHFHSGPLGGD
jgi:epoxyqueuosine reductase QueG